MIQRRLTQHGRIQHRHAAIRAALLSAIAGAAAVLALGPATAAASEAGAPETSTVAAPASPASAPASPTPAPASTPTPATAPLPAANYRVRDVCRAPGPHRVSCRAQELVPETAVAAAHTHPIGVARVTPLKAPTPAEGAYGLRPEDLKDAYFPGGTHDAPSTQTVALIEAYNDLHAQADLEAYGQAFKPKLPTLKTCSPTAVEPEPECFEKVNQKGETGEATLPFPKNEAEEQAARELCAERQDGSEPLEKWVEKEKACVAAEEAEGWSEETSLDIEMAHAVCQNCRIVLVEAESPENEPLNEAEDTAAEKLGATEISNSWGGEGPASKAEIKAFEHPGIIITAAAGDNGYLNWTEAEEAKVLRKKYNAGAEYPASSPDVIAVGGTSLILKEEAGGKTAWQSETVWNDDNSKENNGAGGSGCSSYFPAPEWQLDLPNWSAIGCEDRRAVADVSADGDPNTGVAVYDSETYCEEPYEEKGKVYRERTPWCTFGGTSVGTPLIAAMYALAGGAHNVEYPAKTLYEHLETSLLHKVTGSNGECDGDYASGCTGSMDPSSPRFDFDCGQGVLICNAAAGCEGDYYAGPTGVGSPNGIGAFKPEDHLAKDAKACESKSSKSTAGTETSPPPPATQPVTPLTTTDPGTSSGPSKSVQTIPSISSLALTKTARIALSRHHADQTASQISIAFTLNTAARIHVTLARQMIVHGRVRWQTLPYTLTTSAAKGRDTVHLHARNRLAPGVYRLRATPAGGRPRTLTFTVG